MKTDASDQSAIKALQSCLEKISFIKKFRLRRINSEFGDNPGFFLLGYVQVWVYQSVRKESYKNSNIPLEV